MKLNHIYGRVRHCIRTGTADKWRRSALLHHNDCMPQERWNSLGRTMFFMTHDNPKLGDYDAVVKRCKKYTPDATEVDIERRYRVYLNQIALDKNPHYDWQVPF
ncbi:hypothetical protein ABFV67_11415 [Vibrio metschnikovii]|uniref:Uncharacterized protein n=1 Tax=bacterium 19PA01SH03 TaxID=2920705 RepID=A0AAU6SP45_UNCXX|nr:hypothetical protein [Vibrio metschnikovii]EKO3882742.1 hypothetical protein [Vibrio metschnikovii]